MNDGDFFDTVPVLVHQIERCLPCDDRVHVVILYAENEGNPRTHPQPQGGCTDHDDKNDALLEEFVVNMNAELGRQGTNAIIQPLPDTKGLHGAERSQVMTKSQEGWERFTDGTDDHYAIKVAIIILSKRLFLSELTAPCILALLKVGPPHL